MDLVSSVWGSTTSVQLIKLREHIIVLSSELPARIIPEAANCGSSQNHHLRVQPRSLVILVAKLSDNPSEDFVS